MIRSTLKILLEHGSQYIKSPESVTLPEIFRGVPVLKNSVESYSREQLARAAELCPTGALMSDPFSLDMGRCLFCGECQRIAPSQIVFTNEHRMWAFSREDLVVSPDHPFVLRGLEKPHRMFANSLHLRELCAGGDGSSEAELDAAGNVNFDMRRWGIDFTASPRHCDALVVTGPITRAMSGPLEATFAAIPQPRLLIVVGSDAISGGLFADSPQIDRSPLTRHTPELYIPGNPPHPLTFIGGLRALVGK